MQIVCISRGSLSGGKELAELLAKKLDYTCLSRENLLDAARKEGIQVGKLEMAMIKPRIFSERLAIEREYYRAFTTAYLCDRALEGRVVYHGRTGHLLLPGVSHILRVRAVSSDERRIRLVMNEKGIERDKARRYLHEVDEDRRRWVRSMYGISLDEPIHYDIVINLDQMSIPNAAVALTGLAQLPDFQMTPASQKAMLNLRLGAHCRLALARDERTFGTNFNVRADAGVVTVSYLPQDARCAELIPQVLTSVPDVIEVRTTMATTNILWIEEEYQPHSEVYNQVVDIATKWNAAVELIRLAPEQENPQPQEETLTEENLVATRPTVKEYNGGVEDDVPEGLDDNGGLKPILDDLAGIGRSGGGRTVYGDHRQLVNALDRNVPYTLIVVGDIFLSKGHSAKLRATRDLQSFLSDRLKAPVVAADDLGRRYLFGKRDVVRTVTLLAVTLVIYSLVFVYQEPILAFLAHAGWYAESIKGTFMARFEWIPKALVSSAVFLVIPVVAYSYGSVTSAILKLIRME